MHSTNRLQNNQHKIMVAQSAAIHKLAFAMEFVN